jgi:hypothetical protein
MNPNFNETSFYKEKLNNLAESYKRLNLDFNDIQEDEFESENAATSYKMAESVLDAPNDYHAISEQQSIDSYRQYFP